MSLYCLRSSLLIFWGNFFFFEKILLSLRRKSLMKRGFHFVTRNGNAFQAQENCYFGLTVDWIITFLGQMFSIVHILWLLILDIQAYEFIFGSKANGTPHTTQVPYFHTGNSLMKYDYNKNFLIYFLDSDIFRFASKLVIHSSVGKLWVENNFQMNNTYCYSIVNGLVSIQVY